MSDLIDPNRDERRKILLTQVDVPAAIPDFASEGFLDSADLWWLYEEHRIMSPADAWLLAMMWDDELTDGEVELLGSPGFWEWFDRWCRRTA